MMETAFDEKAQLGITENEDGGLELRVAGDIASTEIRDDLIAWVKAVKEHATELNTQHGGRAYCIVDVSELYGFDEESSEIIRHLAEGSDYPVLKTAIVGGNLLTKMAIRTISYLTKRTDIKTFDTREEALAWLKSNGA
jgi:hypothetical protein